MLGIEREVKLEGYTAEIYSCYIVLLFYLSILNLLIDVWELRDRSLGKIGITRNILQKSTFVIAQYCVIYKNE